MSGNARPVGKGTPLRAPASVRVVVAATGLIAAKMIGRLWWPGGVWEGVPRELRRAVRWHRQENLFCLPHETRGRLAEENEADEMLPLGMRDSLAERLEAGCTEGRGEASMADAIEVATLSLQLTIE